MSKWVPNNAEIARISGELGLALVSRFNRETTNIAKHRAPRKTGRLSNSIGSSVRVSRISVRGKVGSRVKYAATVNNGSRPHVIRARRRKALRFHWERLGRVVYFTKVNHPGTGATPYLTSAAAQAARRHGFRWTRHLSPDTVSGAL